MRAKDIQSLTTLRAHLSEHVQHVQETGRPLFVTANGRAAAVILSPDAYDALAEKAELAENLAVITRGLEDVRAGRLKDARAGIRSIAAKHGLTLNR